MQQEIQEQNLTGFLSIVIGILHIIFMHDFQHCLREELISMHSLETSERKYQCNVYQHYTKLDPMFQVHFADYTHKGDPISQNT